MDASPPPPRTFEQMLADGAGGRTGGQCRALVHLIVGHPSAEVGATSAEWARRLGLPAEAAEAVEAVEAALEELTAPRRREYAARRAARSPRADPAWPRALIGDTDWQDAACDIRDALASLEREYDHADLPAAPSTWVSEDIRRWCCSPRTMPASSDAVSMSCRAVSTPWTRCFTPRKAGRRAGGSRACWRRGRGWTGSTASRPNHLPVRVRYGSRRPRLADLAADILDGLGRVGTQAAVRRTLPADLTLLVPFLLTDATDTLVVLDAGWLGVDGVEDLIATAAVADHQLWLVLGETPTAELAELLRAHCDPWMPLAEAAAHWRLTPAAGKNAARLRIPVLTGQMSSETARHTVADGLAGLTPAHRRAVEDVYTRATVQPTISALHALGLTDENFLRCLRVRELATDGAELRLRDRTIPVPAHLCRALARQRLHAGVIGQRPGDQLLTFDGSVSAPSALAWY